MGAYSVTTSKSPEQVVARAKDFFGHGGAGLELVREEGCCLAFEGGEGHVSVTATTADDRTEVALETREWDYQVRKFMTQI